MNSMVQYPELEPIDRVRVAERSGTATIGNTEYRAAVACLYGIVKLSPRVAHRIMRNIIGIYRGLSLIDDGHIE
jgi:hypothetical protein